MKFKKWVWASEGRAMQGDTQCHREIIVVAVVEDTREEAEAFKRGEGIVTECRCEGLVAGGEICRECRKMFESSPRIS